MSLAPLLHRHISPAILLSRPSRCPPSELTNPQCDPEAAQFLLTHPIIAPKTTIMPLDVTHQCLGTPAVQTKLLGLPADSSPPSPETPLPTPIRALFHEIMTFFAKTYAEE